MGAFSRNKGSREERGLVQYLIAHGWTDVRRIPLSGAMDGFKHDVEGCKPHKQTFELKSRNSSFKTIYNLYHRYRLGDNVVRFSLSSSGPFVAFGTDLDEVRKTQDVHFLNLALNPPPTKDLKTFERISRLDKLRAGADYLVIKDNGHHRLFLRFWT